MKKYWEVHFMKYEILGQEEFLYVCMLGECNGTSPIHEETTNPENTWEQMGPWLAGMPTLLKWWSNFFSIDWFIYLVFGGVLLFLFFNAFLYVHKNTNK